MILDLRCYNETTKQWEAPLANGVDLDALGVALTQHEKDTALALTQTNGNLTTLDNKVTEHLDEYATTQNLTFYVNAINGSDSNDGKTNDNAFKTIQKAINMLPKFVDHTVTINVAEGVYDDNVDIRGFVGRGRIILNGSTVLTTERTITKLTINNVTLRITVSGFALTQDVNISYAANYVEVARLKLLSNTSVQGIFIWGSPLVSVENCEITERTNAITVNHGKVYSSNNIGTGNVFGLLSQRGATLSKSGTQPSGNTTESFNTGGVIR